MNWNITDSLYVRAESPLHCDSDLHQFLDAFWVERVKSFYLTFLDEHQCCRLFRRESDNAWIYLKSSAANSCGIKNSSIGGLSKDEQTAIAEDLLPNAFNYEAIRNILAISNRSSLINALMAFRDKATITPGSGLYKSLFEDLLQFKSKSARRNINASLEQGIRSICMSYFLFSIGKDRLLFPLNNNNYYDRYSYRDYKNYSFFPHGDIYDAISSLDDNTIARFMRLLLCTSIKTLDDFKQSDYDLLLQHFEAEPGKSKRQIASAKISAINNVVALLVKNGRHDLDYRRPTRSTQRQGKTDGTFDYLASENIGHTDMEEWRAAFVNYIEFKLDQDDITDPRSIARGLNSLADYLMDRRNTNLSVPRKLKKFGKDHTDGWIAWMKRKGVSKNAQSRAIGIAEDFFLWAQAVAGIWPNEKPLPLTRYDQPKRSSHAKSIRGVVPNSHRNWLLDILNNRPPEDIVYVLEDGHKIKKNSPTKKNVMKVLLTYPLRKSQVVWFDEHKCIHPSEFGNGLYVNTNKTGKPYVIPYLPAETEEALEEERDWQKRYNIPLTKPIAYMGKKNPRFAPVYPLFRLIGSQKPLSSKTIDDYWAKLIRQLEGEINDYLIARNEPTINLFQDDGEKPVYDIHTLRVTGITHFIEAGVSPDIVMLIAGHASLNMTFYYTKRTYSSIREMLKDASDQLRIDTARLKSALQEDLQGAFALFNLSGNKEVLKALHPSFWHFMDHGICPGRTCPTGKERLCGLCQDLITGPIYLLGLTARANMVFEHAQQKLRVVRNNRTNKLGSSTVWREAEKYSQEYIALCKLIFDLHKKLDDPCTSTENKLYSRSDIKIHLEEVPEFEFVFRRCIEIEALPDSDENDTINKAWHLREKLFHNLGIENQLLIYVSDEKRLQVLNNMWERFVNNYPAIDERAKIFAKNPPKKIGMEELSNILEVIDSNDDTKRS